MVLCQMFKLETPLKIANCYGRSNKAAYDILGFIVEILKRKIRGESPQDSAMIHFHEKGRLGGFHPECCHPLLPPYPCTAELVPFRLEFESEWNRFGHTCVPRP